MKSESDRRRFRMSPIIICLTAAAWFAAVPMTVPHTASAGSAPAVLTCKSVGAGRVTTLTGEIPGDYEIFNLKIKKGKEEYEIKSLGAVDRDLDPEVRAKLEADGVIAKDRVITVVEDFKRGVFTMALRRGENYDLRLYALPSTIRARISDNSTKASFDAFLLEGDAYPKPIKMRCTYDHSI